MTWLRKLFTRRRRYRVSYRVSRRTAEIGVRMALGAQRPQVLFLVLRESMRMAAVGVALGIPFALLAGYLVRSMLFGLAPYDWLSFVIAFICVAGIGVMAGLEPAQRAASINPTQALRNE
jgi:ABC-type antimicrobial peptide transport system permease subunit